MFLPSAFASQKRAYDRSTRLSGHARIGSVSFILCVFRVEVPRHFYTVFVREAHQTISGDPDAPYSGGLFSELLLFAGLLTQLLDIPLEEHHPDLARL